MNDNEVRFGVTHAQLEVQYDGVPEWMWPDLLRWIQDQSDWHRAGTTTELEARFDRLYRVAKPLSDNQANYTFPGHQKLRERKDERLTLQFVDYLLRLGDPGPGARGGRVIRGEHQGYDQPPIWQDFSQEERVARLEQILVESGSTWAPSPPDASGARALTSRTTQAQARELERVVDIAGRAGLHLLDAWRSLYGLQPDPSASHRSSILAVEAAAGPIVSPNNSKRTLGTIIATMRDQGGWSTPLSSKRDDVALVMAETIWTSQLSRHEGDSYETPSAEQAATVLSLAIPLVQLFTTGVIAKQTRLV